MMLLWRDDTFPTTDEVKDQTNLNLKTYSGGSSRVLWYSPEILDKKGTYYKLNTQHYISIAPKLASFGLNFSGANVMSFNLNTGEVKKLSASQIPTNEQLTSVEPGVTEQHVFMIITSNVVKQVIVLRK